MLPKKEDMLEAIREERPNQEILDVVEINKCTNGIYRYDVIVKMVTNFKDKKEILDINLPYPKHLYDDWVKRLDSAITRRNNKNFIYN